MLIAALVWIVAAVTAAIVASNKGRSALGWAALCVLASPLALAPLLALRARQVESMPEAQHADLLREAARRLPGGAREI